MGRSLVRLIGFGYGDWSLKQGQSHKASITVDQRVRDQWGKGEVYRIVRYKILFLYWCVVVNKLTTEQGFATACLYSYFWGYIRLLF